MADGQIVEEATPDQFFTNPESDRAKDFLSKILTTEATTALRTRRKSMTHRPHGHHAVAGDRTRPPSLAATACGGGDRVRQHRPGGSEDLKIGIKFDQPGLGLKAGRHFSGFDVDVATYVAKELGYERPTSRRVEAADRGAGDADRRPATSTSSSRPTRSPTSARRRSPSPARTSSPARTCWSGRTTPRSPAPTPSTARSSARSPVPPRRRT